MPGGEETARDGWEELERGGGAGGLDRERSALPPPNTGRFRILKQQNANNTLRVRVMYTHTHNSRLSITFLQVAPRIWQTRINECCCPCIMIYKHRLWTEQQVCSIADTISTHFPI